MKETNVISFEFDKILPSLPEGSLEVLKLEIGSGKLELYRTHWAIKDEPIFDIFIRHNLITQRQLTESQALRNHTPPNIPPVVPGQYNLQQQFIVHGHDEITKLEMDQFVSELGLQPIILHLQASAGMTIIEKIEHYSNVGFGIVLYTPCDVGFKAGELTGKYRARQNVVFEHSYLIGKLGRSRVSAIVKDNIETPNDISSIVYIQYDDGEEWKKNCELNCNKLDIKFSQKQVG